VPAGSEQGKDGDGVPEAEGDPGEGTARTPELEGIRRSVASSSVTVLENLSFSTVANGN
jgi:hypothetical protein